ncbi:hypothetical protein AUJ65_04305 [Candidatus Micrarchaeota archaeon CG1_02_51_15]|nr:MAG: hypothetical protein AUJ65_04305 [Candidatus Micrarchaeota archaeon CG1_02_51_15]
MKKKVGIIGMTCHSCETLLTEAALEVKGVSSARADAKKGVLEVEVENAAALRNVFKAVEESGYSVKGVE